MRVGSASYIVHSSAQIDAGSIIDSDVNAAAAIDYSKLNSAAINANLIPDVNVTRNIGSGVKNFLNGYISKADIGYFYNSVSPDADGTQHIGEVAKNWADVYVNEIKGAAAGQIACWGWGD